MGDHVLTKRLREGVLLAHLRSNNDWIVAKFISDEVGVERFFENFDFRELRKISLFD